MDENHEILRFISDTHRREFHERRKIEWKALVMTVGFYVLATTAKLTGKASLPSSCSIHSLVWVIFLGLAAVLSFYLHRIHKGNRTNKLFAETAEASLINVSHDENLLVVLKSKHVQDVKEKKQRFDWAFWSEAAVVFAFAIAAAFLVTGTNAATPQLTD